MRDITERKQAEKIFKEQIEELERFNHAMVRCETDDHAQTRDQ